MATTFQNNRGVWMVIGILIGLVAGALVPNTPLHASASIGQESFALCTGEVDTGLEGVYTLDYLTGELTGYVINTSTRKFTTAYKHNVLKDFGPEAKNPKFLMVTGAANLPQGRQPVGVGRALIYIAELSSGKVAAYGVPWNTGRATAPGTATLNFVPLDAGSFRTLAIRPQ